MAHRCWAMMLVAAVSPLSAQSAADSAARHLVDRAIVLRQQAFADSTLRSYSARAHGIVTFRAEFGSDRDRASRAVRADEIAVEVYWQRPDRSKQIIRAWRDSTLFPSDLAYHRDHLGIVTDDFGPRIRIGDGDEVADVIHPLSPEGPAYYDYALGDTVAITAPAGRIVLIGLEVRPKDLAQAAVIGKLYLDRDRAQVVRSRLTFTPAAYLDAELEDITVRLERSLIEGRYWLPYRQEIEIRRRSSWVDFPIRGVIRGDWTIDDYQFNLDTLDVAWTGPSIAGLTKPGPGGVWPVPFAALIDSTLAPPSRREMERVRAEALRLGRTALLDGLPRFRPSVSRISEIIRVNRVQGLALGGGLSWRFGGASRLDLGIGYGTSDRRLTGRSAITVATGGLAWTASASREVIDAGAFPAGSGVANSIAAQEWGGDLADYVRLDRAGLAATATLGSARVTGSLGREQAFSLAAIADPARGSRRPNPALGAPAQWTLGASVAADRVRATGIGAGFRVSADLGLDGARYGRFLAIGHATGPAGPGKLGLRGGLGWGTRQLPAWRSFSVGGPGTVIGHAFRGVGGRRAAWLVADWLVGAPGPTIPLGPFGKTSARVQVGPLVAFGGAAGPFSGIPSVQSDRFLATIGGAIELLDRAIRVEVGRSIAGGGGFGLSVDVNRAWWPIL